MLSELSFTLSRIASQTDGSAIVSAHLRAKQKSLAVAKLSAVIIHLRPNTPTARAKAEYKRTLLCHAPNPRRSSSKMQ